mmetsp:Transcript_20117/g.22383  ORF Transcript_20117/g.22383 Transcript_20117/m.22383 type:complete len:161 (-) Transcript_20117:58-540(-)
MAFACADYIISNPDCTSKLTYLRAMVGLLCIVDTNINTSVFSTQALQIKKCIQLLIRLAKEHKMAKQKTNQTISYSDDESQRVPDVITLYIMQNLSTGYIETCSRVCKQWHRVSKDRTLPKRVFRTDPILHLVGIIVYETNRFDDAPQRIRQTMKNLLIP